MSNSAQQDESLSATAIERPIVAAAGRDRNWWSAGGGAILVGAATFLWISSQRADGGAAGDLPLVAAASGPISAPPLPDDLAQLEALARAPPTPQTLAIPTALPTPVQDAFQQQAVAAAPADLLARRRLPAVVVDMGTARSSGVTPAAASVALAAGQQLAAPSAPQAEAAPDLQRRSDGDEAFAARIGAAKADTAQATVLANLSTIMPQGAMVPGVLETALNSDLPGFARAIVSRDVRGFDGTRVLIPRGSRVIGQYSSGVSAGQKRIFIVWTRVITPEGVSIQLTSPGTDALGRGGLEGEVDRHFFERIGGALLLSVVGAAGAAVVDQPTTQVIIGATSGSQGSGAVQRDIPPTIEARQGAPIRIFVARDLDFSAALQVVGQR